MPTIFYSSAPCGAGKTYAIAQDILRDVKVGKNVLLVQPTKELISKTEPYFNFIFCHVIHTEDSVSRTVNHLKSPYDGPHVLCITHSAFEKLPYFHRKQDWTLYIDEAPQAYDFYEFAAKLSHRHLTDHLSTYPMGAAYSQLIIHNSTGIRALAESSGKDSALQTHIDIAKRLNSGKWIGFVKEAQYQDLLKGRSDMLRLFLVLKPSILEGFEQVTIAGARFEETALYKLWSKDGVRFIPSKSLNEKLRYSDHKGGETLTISYAYEENWSKHFRDLDNGRAWNLLIEAVKKEYGERPFLWMANKDVKDEIFGDCAGGQRLPHAPHGLNDYQYNYDNVAFLSALNPNREQFAFLEWKGISKNDLKTATYRHPMYQALMRCSIRDPENRKPKRIIVPDRASAEWLQSLFVGSSLQSLNIDFGEVPIGTKRGRPKKYLSDADRKNAHRGRSKAKISSLTGRLTSSSGLVAKSNEDASPIEKLRDEILLKDIDINSLMRFHGYFYDHTEAAIPMGEAINLSQSEFINVLRELSKRPFSRKEDNQLISPSYCIDVKGVDTHRGNDNFVFANGIWLDFDKGNLKPNDFANLFPRLHMVIYNTWSSTKDHVRYRVYIPTSNVMDLAEYKSITKQILQVIIDAGYFLPKCVPGEPSVKAHGMDLGKMGPVSLFYLPCKNIHSNVNFFKQFKKDRDALKPEDWIQNSILLEEEAPEAVYDPVGMSELTGEQQDALHCAVTKWRNIGTLPGNGDVGLLQLANELWRIGLHAEELEAVLVAESRFAHSPRDRKSQAKRLARRFARKQRTATVPLAHYQIQNRQQSLILIS